MKKNYLLLTLFVFYFNVAQNPAQIDLSFDFRDNVPLMHHKPKKIIELPNGKFLVLFNPIYTQGAIMGYSQYGNNYYEGALMYRLNSDFTIDETFTKPICSVGQTGYLIKDFDVQSDGKIIIVGYFTSINSIPCYNIARLNVDGSLDDTYITLNSQNFNYPSYTSITAVKVMANDQMIIGGKFWFSSGLSSSNNFLKLNSNGTRDYTFKTYNGGGLPSNSVSTVSDYLEVTSLDVDSSGRILYIISRNTADNYGRIFQNGNKDTTFLFGSNPVPSPSVSTILNRRIKALYNGKILVLSPNSFKRLNSDGTIDDSLPVINNAVSFDVESNSDEIYVCLNSSNINKISSTGNVLAQTLSDELTYPTNVFVLASGDIMSNIASQNKNFRFTKFDGNDLLVMNEESSLYKGRGILKNSNDELLILGTSQFRGLMKHHNGIKLLNSDGTIIYNPVLAQGFSNPIALDPFGENNYFFKGVIQPDGKIVLVKVVDKYLGAPNGFSNFLIRLNPDFTLDNSFDGVVPFVTSKILDIALQDNGGILLCTSYGIIRLDSNGTFDSSFNYTMGSGTFNNQANSVKVLANGKILVGGNFTSLESSSIVLNKIARLNSDGTLDSSFQTNNMPNVSYVSSIDVQSDGKILLACSGNKLLRLLPDGDFDTSFVPYQENLPFSLSKVKVLSDDAMLVTLTKEATGSIPANSVLKKLKINGILDSSFDTGSGFNNLVYDIYEDGDNGLIVTGAFTKYDGTFVNGTIRLIGGNGYLITGRNILDSDLNGCSVSDGNYPYLKFNVNNSAFNSVFIPDQYGNYSMAVNEGIYTLTPEFENSTYFSILPSLITVDFPTDSSPYVQDFCITPIGNHPDLEVVLISLNNARPGFDSRYKLFFKNKGNQVQTGTVTVSFNDNVLDLISSNPVQSSQVSNELIYDFSNLLPMETREIDLIFNANAPTENPPLNGGDVLSFTATVSSLLTDDTPNDNIFELNQTVVNSYDPNDKTCLEGKNVTSEVIGEYVHYVIRFENTGTYNAQNITITDYIDTAKFDISTLQPLTGSHLFVTRISDSNKVEFYFQNINLPFQDGTNDGFVAFKIKTNTNLVVGDTFSNTANIYFDYNSAIVTNEYVSIIEQSLSNSDFNFDGDFKIYPNPTDDVLNLSYSQDQAIVVNNISIYNMLGQLVLVIPNAKTIQNIDVSKFSNGEYLVKIDTNKGITNTKFLKK